MGRSLTHQASTFTCQRKRAGSYALLAFQEVSFLKTVFKYATKTRVSANALNTSQQFVKNCNIS